MLKCIEKHIISSFSTRLLFVLFILGFAFPRYSTAQIFQENFGFGAPCLNQGTLANGFFGDEGVWNVSLVGAPAENGPTANEWFISPSDNGDGFDGGCTNPCFDIGFNTNSLHIGNVASPPDFPTADEGAVYAENGFGIFFSTNKRVESPVVDCTGSFNNTCTFIFGHSPNLTDKCFFSYFDGTVWTDLQELPDVGTGICPVGQMVWDLITIDLPASANNNPDVRIGFRWFNDDTEAAGLRPSVIIDNITVNAGPPPALPTPAFSTVDGITQICEQSCITFLNETTYDPDFSEGNATAVFAWEFEGGDPATSDLQNPTVCYDTPGVYDVTLTVTDNIGESAPLIETGYVTVDNCGPQFVISVDNDMPCANEQCINLSSEGTTGNNIDPESWVWTFTHEDGLDVVTSTDPNPTSICLNTLGFYTLTVEATDDDLTQTVTFEDYIEVLDCSGPDIFFSVSQTVICPNVCIQFTDESQTNSEITEWMWELPGGQVEGEPEGFSSQQNPLVCYDMPGSYWATLTAVDAEGPSARPDSVLIVVDPCTGEPQADFAASDTVICQGDCVSFQNQSLGSQSGYTWIFNGSNELTSNEENPDVICYDSVGTYTVQLIVESELFPSDTEFKEGYIRVEGCLNPPVPRIRVSQDTVCAGKCVDYFSESTAFQDELLIYDWSFQGAAEGSETSTDEDPAGICYNEPGTYDVALTVTQPDGQDSTRVFEDVITVVATPECRPQIIPNIPDTICAGDCAFLSAEFIDADSVRWTIPGGNPETSNAFEPGLVCFDEIGDYTILVEAFNPAGPSTPVFQNIFVGERPPLDAGPDLTINSGATVELTAGLGGQEPNGSFLWQPFDLVDDFRAQTVFTSPQETTVFIVYYDQDSSCTAIDSVTVNVNFVSAVGVPNSFSPNGDGINDVVRVLGQGIARMEFKIFNRYGQLVFETNSQSEGWDGTFNDRDLNAGTFVYTLEVSFSEGLRETYTGNITLVR